MRGDWKRNYYGYGSGHLVLVILGIVCGAVVGATAAATFLDPIVIAVFGIIAAVAVAVTNALDTGGNYKRFNTAWSDLNAAIIEYKIEPSDANLKKVSDAYRNGENVIRQIAQKVEA